MNPQDFTRAQALDPTTPVDVLTAIAQNRPDLFGALAANPAVPADMLAWLATLGNPEVNAALGARGQAPVPAPAFGIPAVPAPPAPGTAFEQPAPMGQYGAPAPAKKSKRGVLIAALVAAVLVIGGGAWAANHFLFSKLGGASTPQAAVENLLAGLESQDKVALYGALSPVDTNYLGSVTGGLTKHFEGQLDSKKTSDAAGDYLEAFSLTSKDVSYEVEQITDDYARVTITEGSFVLDADTDKLVAATVALLESTKGTKLEELVTSTGGTYPTEAELREDITASIEETFPFEFTAADLVLDTTGLSSYLNVPDLDSLLGGADLAIPEPTEIPLYFVAAKEDGNWFVSPLLTGADIQASAMGLATDYTKITNASYADTPEQAGSDLVASFKTALTELDFSGTSAHLVEAERRTAIATQSLPLNDYERQQFEEVISALDISDATFSVDRTEGDIAYLKLDSFEIAGEIEGSSMSVSLSSDCTDISAEGMEMSVCLADVPAALELGLDQIRLIAVKESGGWVIGSSQSAMDSVGVIGANVLRLADEGKLTDQQWWMDNMGVLTDLLGTAQF